MQPFDFASIFIIKKQDMIKKSHVEGYNQPSRLQIWTVRFNNLALGNLSGLFTGSD
jgi:hypothetical protein